MIILAYITMIIDHLAVLAVHLGVLPLSGVLAMKGIGTLALPLFLVCLAYGYKKTKNTYAYVGRLLLVGLLAQVPYMMFFQVNNLNIMFTLGAVILAYRFIENKELHAGILASLLFVVGLDGGVIWLLIGLVMFKFLHFYGVQSIENRAMFPRVGRWKYAIYPVHLIVLLLIQEAFI